MNELKIITDHKWRSFMYGYELPSKWRKEFDWMDDEEYGCCQFAVYKKWVYPVGEFLRLSGESPFRGWHGYVSETFFSGVVIELSNDGESYRIGRYCQ